MLHPYGCPVDSGSVIWRADILMPLAEHDEPSLLEWVAEPAAPLGDSQKRTQLRSRG